MIVAVPAYAQRADSAGVGGQERLGIALAGGGALGFAHIGVLLVLEEYGISPEIVVGTSIGSIVGALYAAGYAPSDIAAIATSADWNQLLFDQRERAQLRYQERRFDRLYRGRLAFDEGEVVFGTGASTGQAVVEVLDDLLRRYATVDRFDDMPRSLAVVATDLVTGEEVVYAAGDLKSAIRGSIAVPGAFEPLYYRGRFLIDGGWSNNVPVDVTRKAGAETVIAVNLSLLDRDATEIRDIPTVLNQASRILRQQKINENLAAADLVITPDLRGFTPADFGRAEELIEIGRSAALDQLDEIIALRERLGPRNGPARRNLLPEGDRIITVGAVAVKAPYFMSKPAMTDLIGRLEGQTLPLSQLQKLVYDRYEIDQFHFISYELRPTAEPEVFKLDLYPVRGVQNAAELWISAGIRTQVLESLYTRGIVHAYSRTPIGKPNDSGHAPELRAEGWLSDVGSARVGLDLPIFGGVSVQPRAYVLSRPLSFYDGRTLEALYFRRRSGGDVNLVFESRRLWHIELGGFGEWRWTERQQGASVIETEGESVGGGRIGAHLDLLDRGVYPRRGNDTRFGAQTWWREVPEQPEATVSLDHRSYIPLGERTVFRIDLRGGTDLNTGIDVEDRFTVGGIEDLPGLLYQEEIGRHVAIVGGGFRFELFRLPFAIGDAGYLLLRGRVGRVWNDDIRAFWDPGTIPDLVGGGMLGIGFGTPLGEVSTGVALDHRLRPITFFMLGPTATPDGSTWRW